ncbi:hypothetical protein GCM10022255_059160 [Dactylosporangium darangshiense]|uniref:Uncharacterized protein n=1 Tax=Dactylosporangium darangshiense TaxID=579108 RepID=A0ABP8DF58_9ACTN
MRRAAGSCVTGRRLAVAAAKGIRTGPKTILRDAVGDEPPLQLGDPPYSGEPDWRPLTCWAMARAQSSDSVLVVSTSRSYTTPL